MINNLMLADNIQVFISRRVIHTSENTTKIYETYDDKTIIRNMIKQMKYSISCFLAFDGETLPKFSCSHQNAFWTKIKVSPLSLHL